MADYTLRIHQLSGALLGEVTLPGTALVRDILTAFAQEPQRLLVKRKLMYQGKILAETDVLHTLFSKGEVGEVIDLHLLQQSLRVQILRDEGSETSRDSMRLNVALCGPRQSGKSNIVTRLVSDTFLGTDLSTSTGVDFKRIHVLADDVRYRILLWDIPGCWVRQSFVQGKDAVLLVIDITSPEPFSRLDPWCRQIEDASILTKVMIGNKLDLEGERQISYEDAQRFAAERGFHYLEASAKDGRNVQDALEFAVMDIRTRGGGHEPPPEHEMLEEERCRCAVQWWWVLGPPRARRGFGLVLDLSLMVASACESKSGCMVLQERQRPFEDLIYLMKTFNFHALADSVSVWMLQANPHSCSNRLVAR